jgi:hypothetical protein
MKLKLEPGRLVSLWESHEESAKAAGEVRVGSVDDIGGHTFPAGTLAIVVEKRWTGMVSGGPDEWFILVGDVKGWVYGRDCKSLGYKPRRKKDDTN